MNADCRGAEGDFQVCDYFPSIMSQTNLPKPLKFPAEIGVTQLTDSCLEVHGGLGSLGEVWPIFRCRKRLNDGQILTTYTPTA